MTKEALKKMTGGEAIAEMLRVYGAEYMFGMGGFQLLPMYDAIARGGNKSPRHIMINDERSGAFAADAYARITSKVGFCDGTLGPGATNLTSGLAEASTAGIPLVAITGDAHQDYVGNNMTQEIPQKEVLSPLTKEVIRADNLKRLPELMNRAFLVSTSGKPGPVLVSVPENVMHGTWEFSDQDFYVDPHSKAVPAHRTRPEEREIGVAAEMIRNASSPVILVGGGIHLSGAYDELRTFVEDLGIPVGYTLSGKGAISCSHPQCIHLFGRYDRIANEIIRNADLIIAVGFKFGEVATVRYSLIPPTAKIIQIDIVPEAFGKYQRVDSALWGDCKATLSALQDELRDSARSQRDRRSGFLKAVTQRRIDWKNENLSKLVSDENPVSMARFCHDLSRVMPKNGILLTDGGFAAHWTGLLYDAPTAGRTYVANRGNASIGYGLPGGIGAQLAAGDRPVVAVTGDGGFQLSMGELETAIREKIPLTLVIINNAASGYVKGLQYLMYGGRFQSCDLHETDYAAVARAIGCHGIRIEDPKYLEGALRECIADRSGPSVIDLVVTRDPSKMMPGIDPRTQKVRSGDRPV